MFSPYLLPSAAWHFLVSVATNDAKYVQPPTGCFSSLFQQLFSESCASVGTLTCLGNMKERIISAEKSDSNCFTVVFWKEMEHSIGSDVSGCLRGNCYQNVTSGFLLRLVSPEIHQLSVCLNWRRWSQKEWKIHVHVSSLGFSSSLPQSPFELLVDWYQPSAPISILPTTVPMGRLELSRTAKVKLLSLSVWNWVLKLEF